jgi:hypothetical protein
MNRFGEIGDQSRLVTWMLLVGEIARRAYTPSMASTVLTHRFGRFEVRRAQRRLCSRMKRARNLQGRKIK